MWTTPSSPSAGSGITDPCGPFMSHFVCTTVIKIVIVMLPHLFVTFQLLPRYSLHVSFPAVHVNAKVTHTYTFLDLAIGILFILLMHNGTSLKVQGRSTRKRAINQMLILAHTTSMGSRREPSVESVMGADLVIIISCSRRQWDLVINISCSFKLTSRRRLPSLGSRGTLET